MRPITVLPLLLSGVLAGAELPMPPVSDPVGLGPRLALIDALRAEGAVVPEGANLEALKELYWKRHGGLPGQVRPENELGTVDEAAATRDRVQRLRDELARHHVRAPAGSDEQELAGLLRAARDREAALAQEASAAAAAGERRRPPPTAEKPTAGAEEKPAPAATAPAATDAQRLAEWKRRVAAPLAKLDPRPVDAPPIFPWGERPLPTGNGQGRVRVIRSDGREELLEKLPDDDHDIAQLWELHDLDVQRYTSDATGTHAEVNEWKPLFFVTGAGWVQDPDAKRRWIEDNLFGEWFDTLLYGPNVDGGPMELIRHAREKVEAAQNRLIPARASANDPGLDDAHRAKAETEADECEAEMVQAMTAFEREIADRAAALGLPAAPLIGSERATLSIRELQTRAERLAIEAHVAREAAKLKPDPAQTARAEETMRDWEALMQRIAVQMAQRRAQMAAATPP